MIEKINIKRVMQFTIFIIIFSFSVLYSMYKCEEKTILKNEVTQLNINMVLLKLLDQGEIEKVGKLLSFDIERTMIYLIENNYIKDVDNICEYVKKDNINLLKKYDEYLSIYYINQIINYCKKNSIIERQIGSETSKQNFMDDIKYNKSKAGI